MATHTTRRVAAWMFLLLVAAIRSRADEMAHVRSESTYIRTVLAEAMQYSPTVSELVDRIQESNVIAHVECAHFKSVTLEGRTLFVLATRDVRYVRVQVDCLLMRPQLIAIIGHELQHVTEIVSAPDVVDERSFGRLLNRIGFVTCRSSQEQYETDAALATGERVTQEMFSRRDVSTRVVSLTRATHGSVR